MSYEQETPGPGSKSDGDRARIISGLDPNRTLQRSESGNTILFDRAAGIAITLPKAQEGLKFRFVTTVALTSNAYSIVCEGSFAFMVGKVNGTVEGTSAGEWYPANRSHFANGSTHVGISSNGTTTGGLVGSIIELECLSPSLWLITGTLACSGVPATPFTT